MLTGRRRREVDRQAGDSEAELSDRHRELAVRHANRLDRDIEENSTTTTTVNWRP